jgi:hypothetical protein
MIAKGVTVIKRSVTTTPANARNHDDSPSLLLAELLLPCFLLAAAMDPSSCRHAARHAARQAILEGCTCEPSAGELERGFRVENPVTGRFFLCSTDQSAKGRPEWIFFSVLGREELMDSCCRVVKENDDAGTNPRDLEIFTFVPYADSGREQNLMARVLGPSHGLLGPLRRYFFHEGLPPRNHGVIAVVPIPGSFAAAMEVMPEGDKRRWFDMRILDEIRNEAQLVEAFEEVLGGHSHGRRTR